MRKHIRHVVVVFVVAIAAAQLIRPDRVNPVTDFSRTIQAQVGGANTVATVLDRACRDCHSNQTEWRWYSKVAPTSWLMAYGVRAGREAVNFSEWAAYSPEAQRALLDASCQDVSAGKMPGVYTMLRPETKLSAADIQTICAAGQSLASSQTRK